jgi:hypothetical protein
VDRAYRQWEVKCLGKRSILKIESWAALIWMRNDLQAEAVFLSVKA